MKTVFAGLTTSQPIVKRSFTHVIEMALLLLLVFANSNTFAKDPATPTPEPDKLHLVKESIATENGKVYVNWIIKANSIDCIYIVERSTDGKEYVPIGLKEGIGSMK